MVTVQTLFSLLGVDAEFDIQRFAEEKPDIDKCDIEKAGDQKIGTDDLDVGKPDIAGSAYRKAVDTFLKSQDFMRLGRCIQGRQWHLVMSNSARMKTHCSKLGITCFDNYLTGIRAAARRQDMNEALQLMSRITAKRVKIRNLLAEDKTNAICKA